MLQERENLSEEKDTLASSLETPSQVKMQSKDKQTETDRHEL